MKKPLSSVLLCKHSISKFVLATQYVWRVVQNRCWARGGMLWNPPVPGLGGAADGTPEVPGLG